MMTTRLTRREMLATTAAGAAALGVPAFLRRAMAEDAAKPRKVLFLGGTGFLGPHVVRRLIDRGHEVTLVNRGNRDEMFPDLELIEANRIVDVEPGLAPLQAEIDKGRTWDAVIDTASVHTWVENSAKMLKDAASHYTFVSSLSAYADASEGRVESDPVAEMPDDVADGIDRLPYDMRYYGAVKARSEAAAERHFPGRAFNVRPGLIVGPRDFTHRFTYWPLRVREGGEVLAPGEPEHPVMFIDVRDLGDFMVLGIEKRLAGVYNANGPVDGEMTIGKLLSACKKGTGSDATFTWVDGDFLAERGVNAWAQMPVWIPPVGEYQGFHRTSVEKAREAGLRTRPVGETIRDTVDWFDEWAPEFAEENGWDHQPGVNAPGISRERERELLAEWRARGS